jgi:hypothetical protein
VVSGTAPSGQTAVCGVALSRRSAESKWDSLAVWTAAGLPAPGPSAAVAETRRALSLRAYVKADYHCHAEPRAEKPLPPAGASPLAKSFPCAPLVLPRYFLHKEQPAGR